MHHFTSKTDKNNSQDHFLLKTPLSLEQSQQELPASKPDFVQLMQEHHKTYESYINIPGWQEVLWGVTCPAGELNFQNLQLNYTTSYEAQALRGGFETNMKPLGLSGLIITSDNKITFGLRTGVAMGGYLCNAPAGHCAPGQPGKTVIQAGFTEELETELGLHLDQVSNPVVLGFQTDPDFGRSINTIIYSRTNASFAELVELHRKARDAALLLKAKNYSFNEVQAGLKEQGFINIDAHEHDALVGIPCNMETINQIISTREFEYIFENEKRLSPIMDIGRGSFEILKKALESGITS